MQINLYETVLAFDTYLQKQTLEHLTLEDAALILMRIELFQQAVAETQGIYTAADETETYLPKYPFGIQFDQMPCFSVKDDLHDPYREMPQAYLMAVGCRLASDLNEQVLLKLVDLMDARAQDLEALYKKVRHHVRERQLTAILLNRAQCNRELTLENGLSLGLGAIL